MYFYMNIAKNNKHHIDLPDKLNAETAHIHWHELQRYFARGVAIYVAPDLDLIGIAQNIATDNSVAIEPLINQGKVGAVSNEQAQAFYQSNQMMWAVVVAPWVLVQPDLAISSTTSTDQ